MRQYDIDRNIYYERIKTSMETQIRKNVVVFNDMNTKVDKILKIMNKFDRNFDPVNLFKLGRLLSFRNQLQPFEE